MIDVGAGAGFPSLPLKIAFPQLQITIIDALNKMYKETKKMLKVDADEDALKIEKNLKDLLKLVDSYNVIKKIEN